MAKEVAKQSFQNQKKDKTKSFLDSLLEQVENSDSGDKLDKLKKDVLKFPVFEGEDKEGKIYESVTVSDILEDPKNIIKGLAIEAIDSFPFLEQIYKWYFLGDMTGINISKHSESKISPVADDYYKNMKGVEVGSYEGLTEKDVDMLNEIQSKGGPKAKRVVDVYKSESNINKQLKISEFIELMRDTGRACEDFGMQKDIYIPYVLGMIKKESNFKRKAFNSSGATGFAQHMTQYLPKRLEAAAKDLEKRGAQYDKNAVAKATEFFKQEKEIRKNRSIWPEGVEELVFGSQMQSYMTMRLTRSNFNSLKSSIGDSANTYELYDYLYLAHNMGLGNALKIAKGEPLGTWASNRLNMLNKKKILSGVTDYAVKMRKELYGSKEINMV